MKLYDIVHIADKNKRVGALLSWDTLQSSEDGKIIKCYLQSGDLLLSYRHIPPFSICCPLFICKSTFFSPNITKSKQNFERER